MKTIVNSGTLVGIAAGCVLTFCAAGLAAPFQLIVAETPVGSGSGQPLQRYLVEGTFGAMTRLSDIPADLTNDPIGGAFRSPLELFVGNRAQHSGNSSISRFTFDPTFNTFTPGAIITGNGVTDVAQLAFNPLDGELFQTNFPTGILSRFKFGAEGSAVPNGTITMPDSARQLGVVVRPADQQLFVSRYEGVRRFRRNLDGSYAYISTFYVGPPGGQIHFLKIRHDELYVCELWSNSVYRYRFDAAGDPVFKDAIPSRRVIDVAFSPDGQEMFAANHYEGGITRYRYDAETDSWVQFGDVIPTRQLGGLATSYLPCGEPAQDTDLDSDADLDDFAVFAQCLNGPEPPWSASVANQHVCACLHADEDLDVDINDFAVFQRCFSASARASSCQ